MYIGSANLVPDLDQSVASVARHHLSSGSISNVVSISGDYCDSTGKIIKRFFNDNDFVVGVGTMYFVYRNSSKNSAY